VAWRIEWLGAAVELRQSRGGARQQTQAPENLSSQLFVHKKKVERKTFSIIYYHMQE